VSPGVTKGYVYSRAGNPTRKAFEECIASLESGKYGLAFASGSAATVTIINLLASGDEVISIAGVYGGTQRYFNRVSTPNAGIKFKFVDFTKDGLLEASISPKTKLVWIETPTNPTLTIADIRAVVMIAKKHKIIVVVDNTFMSPYYQRPLELGADIVLHSATKYLSGHSDVLMGAIITNSFELHERLKFLQNAIGAIPSPFDCYMALRGMKTLPLRMEAHSKNAQKIAEFLENHPKVARVLYPGLHSHPQHILAKKQMGGFGGMITFFLKGGLKESRIFLENLRIFVLAESLGDVESLAEHPAIMTHASVPVEQRKALGLSDSLVRLSVGIENIEDLLADIQRALDAIPIQSAL